MNDVSHWVDDYVPPGSRNSNRNFGPGPKRDSRDPRRKPFKGLMSSAKFLAGMTPPDYLVHGLIMRGGTYTMTGNTGHCKTLLAILMAIRTALGEWFLGCKCRQSRVVFFAGENPDNVRYQLYGMCAELGINPGDLDIKWHDGVFSIEDALSAVKAELATHSDLGLCIFDSLQAFFEGDDDNQNAEMLRLAVSFRELTEGHPNKPSGLIIAHPVKKASRENLLPRGGSALTNELDGNFTAWVEPSSAVGEFHWSGKFRGVPFDPLKFEKVVIEPAGLLNADDEQMPMTVIRQIGEQRESDLRADADKIEIDILAAINAERGITANGLHSKTGVARRAIEKALERLTKDKLIRSYKRKLAVTTLGKTTLEMHGI